MRRRSWIALGLAAALVAVLAWPRSPAPAPGFAVRFAAGTDYDYALSWQSEQRTALGDGGALEGAIDLRGTLRLHGYGAQGDRWLVGVRFVELAAHDVTVQGQPVIDDARALTADEAILELRRDGSIASVALAPGASPVLGDLLSALTPQLDFQLGAGARWSAASRGPFGNARAEYERGAAVTRRRVAYDQLSVLPIAPASTTLDSRATLELAPAGHWQRLEDHEQLQVSASGGAGVDAEVTLSLVLTGVRRADRAAPALAGLERRAPGEPRSDGRGDRYALEQKVGGLTRAELLEGLSAGGAIPDMNRWLWRAAGLLELDPALAAEVGELIASGELGAAGTPLALDLLAAAGTDAAQAAMRVGLSSDVVRASDAYPLLLQRMSLIGAPTRETADYIAHEYAESHSGASAYALGAVAGKLGADDLVARLVDDLRGTDDPRTQAHLLGALANAGRPADVELIAGYAASDEREVRAIAARALGSADTPLARRTVTALLADADAHVQREAIAALERLGPTPDELRAITADVTARGVHTGNEQQLVTLASAQLETPEARALLLAIAAHPRTLPDVRDRIAMLLP